MRRPRGPLTAVVTFGAVGIALALVFSPSPATSRDAVYAMSHLMADLGAPAWLSSPDLWEPALNVLLFVPLGVIGMWWVPRIGVLGWTLVGFLASGAIEVTQAVLLPARDGSAVDILTNTTGTFLGATLTQILLRRWVATRRNRSPRQF